MSSSSTAATTISTSADEPPISNTTSTFSGRKVYQSALALLPEPEPESPLHACIQDVRRTHDKHFNRWPPHINVLYPFVPAAEFEAAAQALHHALDSFAPVEDCVLAQLGYFEHGKASCTVWLAPQTPAEALSPAGGGAQDNPNDILVATRPTPHPAIIQLQAACQQAIPHCNDLTASFGGRYTPHLSLGQCRTRQDVQAFKEKLEWSSQPFPVRHLYLLARDGPDDPFTIRFMVPVGGQGEIIKMDHQPREDKSNREGATVPTSGPLSPAEIEMDGSTLEGGGQILRVSLVLATLLRKSLRIHSIRAGRAKPGLQPQHLAGVKLVADIAQAHLQNGAVGSTEIRLDYPLAPSSSSAQQPQPRTEYMADPGTAGSITLLLQASLPCVAFSSSPVPLPIKLTLRGGTTVSHSPSIDYFVHVTAPLLSRMGLRTQTTIQRRGYFPQGGGCVEVMVEPSPSSHTLNPIELAEPGRPTRILACVAGIVNAGGQVESLLLEGLHSALGAVVAHVFGEPLPVVYEANMQTQTPPHHARQSGNKRFRGRPKREVLHVLLVLETSTGCRFGADALWEESMLLRNLSSHNSSAQQHLQEQLCTPLATSLRDLHAAGACVDEHTLDQLVVYMALAHGKSIVRGPPRQMITSLHAETALHVARQITGVEFVQTTPTAEEGPLLIEVVGVGFHS